MREKNLDRGREAQDLFMQTAVEREADVVLICEQYRKLEVGIWYEDRTARAAIHKEFIHKQFIRNRNLRIGKVR